MIRIFKKKYNINLKEHNKESYESAKKMFKTTSRVAIVQATGTGKSYVALQFLNDYKNKKNIILAPSTEILDQFLNNDQIDISSTNLVTYQKLQILFKNNKLDITNIEFIILDEMHRCGAEKWQLAVKKLIELNPKAKILGLTATPVRHTENINMIEQMFNNKCAYELSLSEAICKKILPTPKYISALYDIEDELNNKISKLESIKNKSREIYELTDDLKKIKLSSANLFNMEDIFNTHLGSNKGNKKIKILVFCNDIKSLKKFKPRIKEWLSSSLDLETNVWSYYNGFKNADKEFKSFKDSKDLNVIDVLLSIEKLNEGVHIKDVDSIIMLRKTESHIIYYQQLGRALSASSNKNPIIFDLVNNYKNMEFSNNFMKEFNETKSRIFKNNEKEYENINIDFFDHTHNCLDIFNRIDDLYSYDYWTNDEEKFLIDNYKKLDLDIISDFLSRTKSAIQYKAKILKLTKKKNNWTKEQDEFILKNYGKIPIKDIKESLNVDACISTRLKQLGVRKEKKKAEWSNEDDQTIIDMYYTNTLEEIARTIKVSLHSLYKRIKFLDLKKKPRINWTKDKDNIIINNHKRMTAEKILDLLPGVTINSLQKRIKYLELENKYSWSKEEDDILINNSSNMTIKELNNLLKDKNYHRILKRIKDLNLTCLSQEKFSHEEDKILIDNYAKFNITGLKKILQSRSVYSIKGRARYLGLSGLKANKKWTPEEDKVLIENNGKMTLKQISELLSNRSSAAVYARIKSLELDAQRFGDWTPREDKVLKENHPYISLNKLCDLLKPRTKNAISARITYLGIQKISRKKWTKEEDKILISNIDLNENELLSILDNRTLSSIKNRIRKIIKVKKENNYEQSTNQLP